MYKHAPLIAIMVVTGVLVSLAQGALASETREENAKRLIAQNNQFKAKAEQFHLDAQKNIDEANRLKAGAQSIQKQMKLSPEQYKAALSQFNGDLDQFKAHAAEYNLHATDFQKAVGECHANEAQYQQNVKDFTLHLQTFHMPNIRPPHICGLMNVSTQEAQHMSNSMRMDQVRLVEAEQQLNKAENALAVAQKENFVSTQKAVNEAQRAEKEQQLAGEFGKLAQEYKLLQIEQKALGGAQTHIAASGNTARSSVSAKIRK